MKSILFPTTIAVVTILSGAAFAADVPVVVAPAPVVDPVTAILVPIGSALNVVVQPVVVAPANAVTAVIVPPAAPAAPVVAKY